MRALRIALASGLVSVGFSFTACAEAEATSGSLDAGGTSTVPTLDAGAETGACESPCPDSGALVEWSPVDLEGLGAVTLMAVRGIESRVWIAGSRGFVAYAEGGAWTRLGVPTSESIVALWGSSATDVWAAGGGNTLYAFAEADAGWAATQLLTGSASHPFPHYDETDLTGAVALTGTGPDDVWAVLVSRNSRDPFSTQPKAPEGSHLWHKTKDAGFALEFGCASRSYPCALYRATWASGATVWFAGDRGRTARGARGEIAPNGPIEVETNTNADLNGIWGASDADVWAVGARGTLLRWSGEAWTTWESPTNVDLYAVWGRAADDVWAVGASGTAIHFDGARWTRSETGTTEPLYAVGGTGGDVWAGGRGALLHHGVRPEGRQP